MQANHMEIKDYWIGQMQHQILAVQNHQMEFKRVVKNAQLMNSDQNYRNPVSYRYHIFVMQHE